MMTKIREARLRANVRQQDVAEALGRTGMWLCNAELGKYPLKPEQEQMILRAIRLLAQYRDVVREQKQNLLADLRIPPERCRSVE